MMVKMPAKHVDGKLVPLEGEERELAIEARQAYERAVIEAEVARKNLTRLEEKRHRAYCDVCDTNGWGVDTLYLKAIGSTLWPIRGDVVTLDGEQLSVLETSDGRPYVVFRSMEVRLDRFSGPWSFALKSMVETADELAAEADRLRRRVDELSAEHVTVPREP